MLCLINPFVCVSSFGDVNGPVEVLALRSVVYVVEVTDSHIEFILPVLGLSMMHVWRWMRAAFLRISGRVQVLIRHAGIASELQQIVSFI